MKIREITETPYLQKTLSQISQQVKTGAPVPPNKLPRGPVKSAQIKAPINQMNKQADQKLMKPGTTLPMPTGPNKETDYQVDQVKGDQVTMKTKRPTQQAPQSITVNKKDLNPVITNLQRRQKAQTSQ
jgi:hypothetical protein